MATKQDRKFEIVLYPDSTNYNCSEVLIKAQQFFEYWAYILHDKDKNDDGTPKKPHYHFYGKYEDKRLTLAGIAYQLGCPENAIEYVKTWKGAIRYLTHIDYPDKTPYPLESVFSNFSLETYFRCEHDDDEKAAKIFEYIIEHEGCTMKSVTAWVFENHLWSAYRRGFAVFGQLLKGDNYNESRRYPPCGH